MIDSWTSDLKRNKNGYLKTRLVTCIYGDDQPFVLKTKYYYDKKGRCIKCKPQAIKESPSVEKYSYNSEGYVSKVSSKWSLGDTTMSTITYDENGNPLKVKGNNYTCNYKNTYNSDKMLTKVKKVYKFEDFSSKDTYEISYTTISVPSSYLKRIKTQQRAICNSFWGFEPDTEGILVAGW